jgi:hypothetical protein
MTLTFRTPGAWGMGKGSNLSAAEGDANIYTLSERIAAIEGSLPTAVDIVSATVDGYNLRFTLSDDTVLGPFLLRPALLNPRGSWEPSTPYAELDCVRQNGGFYMVTTTHTSDTTFDPNAEMSGGFQLYRLIARDVTLTKPVFHLTDAEIIPALGQENGYFRITRGTTVDFILPNNTTGTYPTPVPFAIGTEFTICQRGAGVIHVWGASGVSVYSRTSSNFRTSGVGTVIHVKKTATNDWDVWGETGT